MSGALRDPLLSSDRRPDLEQRSVRADLVDELKSIVALAGPACIQLGFQQVKTYSYLDADDPICFFWPLVVGKYDLLLLLSSSWILPVPSFRHVLVQAVLVTNQVYAGSLGADALAAAAIGFTVCRSILTPRDFVICMTNGTGNGWGGL